MTVLINLTKGFTTVIDDIDADLALYKWHAVDTPVYARRCIKPNGKQRRLFLHRLILERMIGRPLAKGEQCDHKDNDSLNNRRSNLRVATVAQNAYNRRGRNPSGYKGVTLNKRSGKWQVYVTAGGKSHFIGSFSTPYEGHLAYIRAAKELHGEYFNGSQKGGV